MVGRFQHQSDRTTVPTLPTSATALLDNSDIVLLPGRQEKVQQVTKAIKPKRSPGEGKLALIPSSPAAPGQDPDLDGCRGALGRTMNPKGQASGRSLDVTEKPHHRGCG